jgi:hypothetical protein
MLLKCHTESNDVRDGHLMHPRVRVPDLERMETTKMPGIVLSFITLTGLFKLLQH